MICSGHGHFSRSPVPGVREFLESRRLLVAIAQIWLVGRREQKEEAPSVSRRAFSFFSALPPKLLTYISPGREHVLAVVQLQLGRPRKKAKKRAYITGRPIYAPDVQQFCLVSFSSPLLRRSGPVPFSHFSARNVCLCACGARQGRARRGAQRTPDLARLRRVATTRVAPNISAHTHNQEIYEIKRHSCAVKQYRLGYCIYRR